MRFGPRVREIRRQRQLTQRELASRLGVSFSYISKVENEKLHFGEYPSEKFILKIADILKVDAEELLLLADKVPATIRQRIRERPDVFRTLASLDDSLLDELVEQVEVRRYGKSGQSLNEADCSGSDRS